MRLRNEELAAMIILVFSLLAVGALYLLSGASKPYSWSSADGDRVSVTGPVLSRESTYRGGHITLVVKTGSGPLDVFVPSSSDAFEAANATRPGDEIEAIGRVKTYKGQKEVVAETIKKNSPLSRSKLIKPSRRLFQTRRAARGRPFVLENVFV